MLQPFVNPHVNPTIRNYDEFSDSKESLRLNVKKRRFDDLQFNSYLGHLLHLNFINLVDLDLSFNNLTSIDALPSLPNLKYLNVANNKLIKFPNNLNTFGNLVSLNLSRNRISEPFPALISCNLTELISLKLDCNFISGLPQDFNQLRSLETLTLGSSLGGNLLSTIPNNIISYLINLKHLDLTNNLLTSLPSDIGHTHSKLTNLWVSNNLLETLPQSLGKLSNLIRLDLSRNKLSYLPIEMVDLENLQSLDLSGNQLCVIPYDMAKFMSRTCLILTDNPMMRTSIDQIGDFSNDTTSTNTPRLMSPVPLMESNLYDNTLSLTNNGNNSTNLLEKQMNSLSLNELQLDLDPQLDFDLHSQFRSDNNTNPSATNYTNTGSTELKVKPEPNLVVPTLTELAARVVLSKRIGIKPYEVPNSILSKLGTGARPCHYCQSPYVKEFVPDLQYNLCQGHPSLPTTVHYCSTRCKLTAKLAYTSSGLNNRMKSPNRLAPKEIKLSYNSSTSTPRNWKLAFNEENPSENKVNKKKVPVTSWEMVDKLNDW